MWTTFYPKIRYTDRGMKYWIITSIFWTLAFILAAVAWPLALLDIAIFAVWNAQWEATALAKLQKRARTR